jgi:DNA-binding PadR family transcriptional regulator
LSLHYFCPFLDFLPIIKKNYVIAPGTLYGVVKNIQKQGLIETIEVQIEQRKKRTYRITERGKDVLRSEYSRYLKMIELTKKIVNEREDVRDGKECGEEDK